MLRCSPTVVLLLSISCAAGVDDDASTSTTGGSVPWTTSTGGSEQGGAGGAPTSGGAGGQLTVGGAGGGGGEGGAPSTTSSGGEGGLGTGGAGGEGGAGGAPSPTGQAVFVALGSANVTAGSFTESAGWINETSAITASARPGVAMRGPDDAFAMLRTGAAGDLAYMRLDGSGWSAPASVGAGVTTRATPGVAAGASEFVAVFHGDDFKHYFAAFNVGFNPQAQPVGNPQSFGPAPASIALDGVNPIIVFAGDDGNVYDQSRVGGVWQAAAGHGVTGVDETPAIVALDAGADLLVVFNRTNTIVSFMTRSGSNWSTPADIANALTNEPVDIAALPGGRAVLAFRGTNGKAYASVYDPGGAPVWSSPAAIDGPGGDTTSTPAVAPGIGGADAELLYVASGVGDVRHSRLQGATWSASVSAGGTGMTAVAAASAP